MSKQNPITIEDLWRIERLGAPSLSPDGAQAVAAVSRYSMDDNKGSSALWLLSTLGGAPRALTHCGDKDGQPRWSPAATGKTHARELIAFTARREQEGQKDEETQLYVIAPDGGEARRAADVATGVEAFRWCPDGRRLVFISWVWPELKGTRAQAGRHKEFKARKETGYVTSEAQYRHWDRNLPMGRVAHLHLLELDLQGGPGKVRDLFEGSAYELGRADPGAEHFDISPDGRHVCFAFDPAAEKRGDGRFALAEMDIKTGRAVVIAQDAGWDFGTPRYSPGGDRIAFTASHQGRKHTMPSQLAVWQRDGCTHEVVSAQWDHQVHAPLQWEEDGLALLFTVPAGYAFAKLAFRGRDRVFQILVGALVVPAQIGTLPLFLMLKSMGLVNTYAGALVPWLASIFGLFLVRQYSLSIPDEMLEAARIDGAGPWRSFRHVTLPAIAPTLLLVSIISIAGFFQLFAEPYVMTQGGPAQSTVTVLYFMYEEGFKWWNLGSASAVAFVLFLCILAVTLVQLAVAKRMGAYE